MTYDVDYDAIQELSHSINFQLIEEKLLLLQHLKLGSQKYCEINEIGRNSSKYSADAWEEYSLDLKRIVSDYVLDCAIKTRIWQDTLIHFGDKVDIKPEDAEARKGVCIGLVHLGKFNLTLRESCNKIVHATRIELGWKEESNDSGDLFEYWDGSTHLYGTRYEENWHIELKTESCASALSYYYFLIG